VLKRRKLGIASIDMRDAGVWLEAQLNLRDDYEKAVYQLVEKNKAGWSSGAAGHLSGRKKGSKATEIVEWGLAEASITVRPADATNRAVALKSYKSVALAEVDSVDGDENPAKSFAQNSLATVLSKHIDDRVDDGRPKESIIKSLARESSLDVSQVEEIIDDTRRATDANLKAFARVLDVSFDMLKSATRRDYARTIKGMFDEALNEQIPSRWQLESIYCDIIKKIAATAQASAVTGVEFDSDAKIKEATGEYLKRLEDLAIRQVNEYVESGSDEPFYLKAIVDLSADLPVSGSLGLEDHSQLAVSVFRDVVKRFWSNHEKRKREGDNQKAGRVLSAVNRQRLGKMLDAIQTAVSDCQKLLDESQPMATEEKMREAKTRHLSLQHERRMQTGV
jgi:hypothetical protein